MTVDFYGNLDNDKSDATLLKEARAVAGDALKKATAAATEPGEARKIKARFKRETAKGKIERAGKLEEARQAVVDSLAGRAEALSAMEASIAGAYMWGGYYHSDLAAVEDAYDRMKGPFDTQMSSAQKCFNEAARHRKEARMLKLGALTDSVIGTIQKTASGIFGKDLRRKSAPGA